MADHQSMFPTAINNATIQPETVLESIEFNSFDKRLAEDKALNTSISSIPSNSELPTDNASQPITQQKQRNNSHLNTLLTEQIRQQRSDTPSPTSQRASQAEKSPGYVSVVSRTNAARYNSNSDRRSDEILTSQASIPTITSDRGFDPHHNFNTKLPDISGQPDLHGTLQRRLEAFNDFTAPETYLSNAFPIDESLLSMHGRLHTTYLIKTISSIKCDQCKARCKKGGEVYQCSCCKAQICQDCVDERLERAKFDAEDQSWEWNSWNHEPFKHAYIKREADRSDPRLDHKGWEGHVEFDCPELKGWTEVTVRLQLVTNSRSVNAMNKEQGHCCRSSDSGSEGSHNDKCLSKTKKPTRRKRKHKPTSGEDEQVLDISEATMGSRSATFKKMRKWQEAANFSSSGDQRDPLTSPEGQTSSSSWFNSSQSTPPLDTPTTSTPSDTTSNTNHDHDNSDDPHLRPATHQQTDIHTIATRIALARALPLFNVITTTTSSQSATQSPGLSQIQSSHLVELNRGLPETWQIRFDQGDGFDQFGDFVGRRGIVHPSGRPELLYHHSDQAQFVSGQETSSSSNSSSSNDGGVSIADNSFVLSGVTSNIEHEEFRRARVGGYADELQREVEVLFGSLMGQG